MNAVDTRANLGIAISDRSWGKVAHVFQLLHEFLKVLLQILRLRHAEMATSEMGEVTIVGLSAAATVKAFVEMPVKLLAARTTE